MKTMITVALIAMIAGILAGCAIVGAEFEACHDGARVKASLAGMSSETEVSLPFPPQPTEPTDEASE